MPTVAKTEPGTDLFTEDTHFMFGEDGTRQVSEAEKQILERYMDNAGDQSLITFEESKPKPKAKE